MYDCDGNLRAAWRDGGRLLDGKDAPYVPHDADPGVPEAQRISIPEAARELHLSLDRIRKAMAGTDRLLGTYARMQPDWDGRLPPGTLRYFVVGHRYYTTRPWLEHFKQRRTLRLLHAAERGRLRERATTARRSVRQAINCLAGRFCDEGLYVRGYYTEIQPGPLLDLVEQAPPEWPEGRARDALLFLTQLLDAAERD
jgi:hypothetical protein